MRDNLKTRSFLEMIVDQYDESIKRFTERLESSPDAPFRDRMRWAFHLNMEYQEKICAMYTRGDAINDIAPVYIDFIDNFSDLIDVAIEDLEYVRNEYGYGLDKFYRVAAWSILFDVDIEERKRFVGMLDFFGEQKPCDLMLHRAGLLDRPITDRAAGRPAFEPLLDALEAEDPERQIAMLTIFLKKWYPALKKMNVAWIDNHKSKFDIYFGYWCFEAAAAVKVLGLDPDRFERIAYFPIDMVR